MTPYYCRFSKLFTSSIHNMMVEQYIGVVKDTVAIIL